MVRHVLYALLLFGAFIAGVGVFGWVFDFMDLTFFGMFMVGGFIVIVAGSLFDIWRRADLAEGSRVIWSAAIIIFPIVGLLAYVIARPPAGSILYKGETLT